MKKIRWRKKSFSRFPATCIAICMSVYKSYVKCHKFSTHRRTQLRLLSVFADWRKTMDSMHRIRDQTSSYTDETRGARVEKCFYQKSVSVRACSACSHESVTPPHSEHYWCIRKFWVCHLLFAGVQCEHTENMLKREFVMRVRGRNCADVQNLHSVEISALPGISALPKMKK